MYFLFFLVFWLIGIVFIFHPIGVLFVILSGLCLYGVVMSDSPYISKRDRFRNWAEPR